MIDLAYTVQFAGAIEYIDSISAEGYPLHNCPDMTLNNMMVRLL